MIFTPAEIIKRLYKSALRYATHQFPADDIAQEAWRREVKTWTKDFSSKALWYIIHRTVRRAFYALLDGKRRLQVLATTELFYDAKVYPDTTMEDREDNRHRIEWLMDAADLRKRVREYIRLRYYAGLSIKEVAVLYSSTTNAVSSETSVAVRKMREVA